MTDKTAREANEALDRLIEARAALIGADNCDPNKRSRPRILSSLSVLIREQRGRTPPLSVCERSVLGGAFASPRTPIWTGWTDRFRSIRRRLMRNPRGNGDYAAREH